jgi:hypothetical protein
MRIIPLIRCKPRALIVEVFSGRINGVYALECILVLEKGVEENTELIVSKN